MRLPEPDVARELRAGREMKQEPYLLDATRRGVVLASFEQVCSERAWTLLAAHVRTRHVHLVVQADRSPESVMSTLKAYASRALNRMGLDGVDRRRWARHGGTRHLWTQLQVSAAIRYVVCKQGEAMAVFEAAAAC
jgi:REP element-mobilizing transposase RayT